MPRPLPAALAAAGLLALVLAAVQLVPTRSASAAANCDVAAGAEMDTVEQQVLTLVNTARAQQQPPLAPLAANDALNKAAAWMAKDMTKATALSHTDSLGRDPFKRMADCGYARSGGENVGAGSASGGLNSANAIFNAWMGSSGHRQAILYPTFKDVGIAYADANGGRYWAMDFGYGPSGTSAGSTPTPTRTPTPTATPSPMPTATPTPQVWRLVLPMVFADE